jgi:hypothetical protein
MNSYAVFPSPKTTKNTSLKSGAFASHHGELLYLLAVEVVIIKIPPKT